MLIDTSAFIGPWPFKHLPAHTAATLQRHLDASGVTQALVSHLGAVFDCDPMPANRALFQATRRRPALVPVPILNPNLAAWPDHLEECCTRAAGLRAVRLLPSYHELDFRSPRLEALVTAVSERGLRVILSVRLVDHRLDYFALKIQPVSLARLDAWLKANPRLQPLLSGLTLTEVQALVRARRRFACDISFVEWLYSLETLVKQGAKQQLLFGSNTPFFVTQANVAKLEGAAIPAAARDAIAWRNAARLFALRVPNSRM